MSLDSLDRARLGGNATTDLCIAWAKGWAGCRKNGQTGRRAVTGTPDPENRDRSAVTAPGHPTLEPDERLWLESYVERLKKAPGGPLKRLVVYGSKTRGDAGPTSDIDVLGRRRPGRRRERAGVDLRRRRPRRCRSQRRGPDRGRLAPRPGRSCRSPGNVEAESVQLNPVHRPAVTRKGIRHAAPVWLKEARNDLKALRYELVANALVKKRNRWSSRGIDALREQPLDLLLLLKGEAARDAVAVGDVDAGLVGGEALNGPVSKTTPAV